MPNANQRAARMGVGQRCWAASASLQVPIFHQQKRPRFLALEQSAPSDDRYPHAKGPGQPEGVYWYSHVAGNVHPDRWMMTLEAQCPASTHLAMSSFFMSCDRKPPTKASPAPVSYGRHFHRTVVSEPLEAPWEEAGWVGGWVWCAGTPSEQSALTTTGKKKRPT